MNVSFLNPPFHQYFSRSERSPQVAKSGTLYYPVWLAQAAAYLESKGHRIDLKDAIASQTDIDGCVQWLQRSAPDCLVMETSTGSILQDQRSAEIIKSQMPGVTIIFVGPHVTATPEETLTQCDAVDYIVCGEYEQPLLDLVSALEQHSSLEGVRGIAFRRNGAVTVSQAADVLTDLDTIPFAGSVYKRFLNHREYFFAAADYPGIMLMTGRGCPHRCMWCVFNQTLHGRKYRYRSPRNIIAEFEYLIAEYPDLREIWIDDDTFTANKAHLHEVCEAIISKKLRFQHAPFQWYCNARPPLGLDTLLLMKKAGCRLIVTGFESGDADILRAMRKGFSLEQGQELMDNARRAGILVHGCFMVGNIGETRESMQKTLAYAQKLLPDSAQFYFVHPYPGTDYYAWAQSEGAIAAQSYADWLDERGRHKCVMNLPGVSAAEMEQFCNEAYARYHLSPRYLFMKITQLFTQPREGFRSLKSGLSFFMGRITSD